MPNDINRMVVLVESKGIKETKNDIEGLTNSTKKYNTETKHSTDNQNKFTTATGKFRRELPNVASAVYLVQQAYSLLSGAMDTVMEAYEEQYGSELKLQTILNSTSNAIGYTYDKVYELAQAWEDQSGINDAVIIEATAIAATFTQISKEVIPDVIEQAMNMSAIFGQDLQQSMVQLGTATNDPIKGLGRLRRIGISFSEQQKAMIKDLAESGDMLGAQQEIMRELSIEIGNVAKALGDSSLGAIKKYNTAWENLFEEIGENSTNFWAKFAKGATSVIEDITQSLKGKNAKNLIDEIWGTEGLSPEQKASLLPLNEIQSALDLVNEQVNAQEKLARAQIWDGQQYIDDLNTQKTAKEELNTRLYIEQKSLEGLVKLRNEYNVAMQEAIDLAEKEKKVAEEAKALEVRNSVLQEFYDLQRKVQEIGQSKFDKQRADLEIEWLEAKKKAWYELGMHEEELIRITGNYYQIMQDLIDLQERQNDIKLFGTEQQKGVQDFEAYYLQVMEAFGRGSITLERARELINNWGKDISEVEEKVKELGTVTSFDGLFDSFVRGAMDSIDWTESFKESIIDLKVSMLSLGASGISSTIHDLGNAMREGTSGTDSLANSMLGLIDSALEAIGPQLMLAGATRLASTAGFDPTGWALLIAGGGASLFGGLIDSSGSTGGSSTDTFTSAVAVDTYDPTNSLPLSNSSTLSRGTNLSVSNNIINNAGVDISTQESTAPDGSVLLETVLSAVEQTYSVNKRTVPVA